MASNEPNCLPLFVSTVPEKLRSVRAEDPTENEILIKWTMGCAYRPGDIESFKITYCQVEHSQAEKCKGNIATAEAK